MNKKKYGATPFIKEKEDVQAEKNNKSNKPIVFAKENKNPIPVKSNKPVIFVKEKGDDSNSIIMPSQLLNYDKKNTSQIVKNHAPTFFNIEHNSLGVISGYVDKNINKYGNFSLIEKKNIKAIVNDFNFKDLSKILNFGERAEKGYSDIVTRMLKLSSNNEVDINEYLQKIIEAITSFKYEDLLGNTSSNNIFSIFLSKKNIENQLKDSLAIVDCYSVYILDKIPKILSHITLLEDIENEFKKINSDLMCHIVSLKIILLYIENNESSYKSKNILENIDIIKSRLNSLLQSSIGGQITPMQIEAMRKNLVSKVNNARNTILVLVTTWKNQCVSLLSLLNNKKDIGNLAGEIMITKDKIILAIEDNIK